jgi:hypothetical protein
VGDGILTYFGWPTAHEDDAERAVRAALEIVHTVKRASSTEDLAVRIGIATGPVVVGEAAGTGDQSKLAVGSTPSLAARLQGLAVADHIVIAASTRRLVGSAFELTDLGEHGLKGIAEPVHAWRVERALVTESRFDANRGDAALTPMVGREGELDLLLRRWSQAKDGEGQVVVLSGEPGIGKSRILSALRERLDAQGAQALRFQCSPYYVNSAFWPIIDNFERALKFTRDDTADSKLDKLEALVLTQYGRPLADVRFVTSILSIPCEQRHCEGDRRWRSADLGTCTCLYLRQLFGRVYQGRKACRQGAGPLRCRKAAPSCRHPLPRSQNWRRCLRLVKHLDAGLSGPGIAVGR